uniref:MULE transposase domain-containing protein n=1 Tax=Tanacetum cinerariifolium TaxID=118510 RepID=A0A6L2M117_TANCI|nr:hypothetical protein [Tanacetum cinerariifolium]
MSANVARSHDGDCGGEDRPPPYHVPTGCGGCFANRGKGKRKLNLGGRAAGRLHTRNMTRNLLLKDITDKKASSRSGLRCVTNKPLYLSVTMRRIGLATPGRNIARAAQNRKNRAKSTIISRQGSRSLARLGDEMVYTGLKVSTSVHGTQTEFKNLTRGVNCFIRDIDTQMLITRIQQRQEFTKDFSFDYFIKDAELCGLFLADEVAKCNYKEFGDILSFDATYKTNKYKMVFVPFTTIDNNMRSVTVGSGILKKETAKVYRWLLRAFKKAFVRPPNIVVTDQDGAMRLAVVFLIN